MGVEAFISELPLEALDEAILHRSAGSNEFELYSFAIGGRTQRPQQMRWTDRGAHSLLQVRTRVLNEEWRSTLSLWYPAIQGTCDAQAGSPRFFPVSG